jgi:hypothetical protein
VVSSRRRLQTVGCKFVAVGGLAKHKKVSRTEKKGWRRKGSRTVAAAPPQRERRAASLSAATAARVARKILSLLGSLALRRKAS